MNDPPPHYKKDTVHSYFFHNFHYSSRQQTYNKGLSFHTISGSGSNGAVIHYTASEVTKKPITTTDMYLLDSGGQYL